MPHAFIVSGWCTRTRSLRAASKLLESDSRPLWRTATSWLPPLRCAPKAPSHVPVAWPPSGHWALRDLLLLAHRSSLPCSALQQTLAPAMASLGPQQARPAPPTTCLAAAPSSCPVRPQDRVGSVVARALQQDPTPPLPWLHGGHHVRRSVQHQRLTHSRFEAEPQRRIASTLTRCTIQALLALLCCALQHLGRCR